LSLSTEQLVAVINCKALGAYHLHQYTLDLKLDYFVLTSSVHTITGNLEQANYAAANAFLDALAIHRRKLNLSAISLQLGAVSGAGFLDANLKILKLLSIRGFETLHVNEILEVTHKILYTDLDVICIANNDWANIVQFSIDSTKYDHLIIAHMEHKEVKLNEDQLRKKVIKQLTDILCTSEDKLSFSQPMIDYGVDSLMSVEMVNWFKREFNLTISQLDILGGMTTEVLIQNVLKGQVGLPQIN